MELEKSLNQKLNNGNGGFTIVELLVAIVIISAVFLPVMNSFITAARANAKAQKAQSVTSIEEDVMEKIKSTSIEQLFLESTTSTGMLIGNNTLDKDKVLFLSGGEATSFLASPSMDTTIDSLDYKNAPYALCIKDVKATTGDKYNVVVDISTDKYDGTLTGGASDANDFYMPDIKTLKSSEHAVLSWEINSYDTSALDRLADENAVADSGRINIKQYAGTNGIKTTKVLLDEIDGQIKITCNVDYYAGASYPNTVDNLVYTGYFDDKSSENPSSPNVYLFFSTTKGAGCSEYFKNEDIIFEDLTGKKHDFYLILQNGLRSFQDVQDMSDPSKNINLSVKIKEKNLPDYNIPSNIEDEYIPINSSNDSRFYTNIQRGTNEGNMFDKSNKDRIYSVSVSVYDNAENVISTINSTMPTGKEADNR